MTDDSNDVKSTEQATADPKPDEPAYASEADPTASRTKKWLAGAALITAGVVAGSGATYAITAQSNTGQGQFSSAQGGPGGRFGGRYQPPGGVDGQNGQPPGSQATQDPPSGQASSG